MMIREANVAVASLPDAPPGGEDPRLPDRSIGLSGLDYRLLLQGAVTDPLVIASSLS